MVLSGQVKEGIIGLDAEDLRTFVLILIERFDGGDLLQGDLLSGCAVNSLLLEGVKMGPGQDHPPPLPLLQDARTFHQPPLLDLAHADIRLGTALLQHIIYPIPLTPVIFHQHHASPDP